MPTLTGLFSKRTLRQRLGPASSAVRQWGDSDAFDFDRDTRIDRYLFNRAMLDNKAYRRETDGGFREQILRETFNVTCADEALLVGAYNPVRTIVDAYQNVFRGSFGQDITIDDTADGKPVNPRLIDSESDMSPVRRIWKWSLLDTAKHTLQEWAANLGSVGLRVVARNSTERENRRVSIQLDYPGAITDFNEDDRGNVVEIELKYPVAIGDLGQAKEIVEVREVMTKTRFVKEVDGHNVLEADEQRNELGVCPYVLLRHRDDGHEFGRWSYSGSEDIFHWINWIITNQGESIREHSWPEWFAAAGGNAPTEFKFGRTFVKYVKMDPDTPPPIFEPKVADLDQNGAREYWIELMTRLQERQPEIAIGNVKALSGQSGETIAKLLIPAEAAILRARAQYENAIIRAIQIGLSEGIRMGIWDLGTGMGTTDQADAAFSQGLEDFSFSERPALPPTALELMQQAQADVAPQMQKFTLANSAANIVDQEEQLRLAGYSAEEISEIQKRKATQDVVPVDEM